MSSSTKMDISEATSTPNQEVAPTLKRGRYRQMARSGNSRGRQMRLSACLESRC